VALVITVPYLSVLSKGNPVFGPATLWLFALGALLVPMLAAMGMLATIWANTTKGSMLVTLGLYLLMLLPSGTIRPSKVLTAYEIQRSLLIQSINPVDAMNSFLANVVVRDGPLAANWILLATPAVVGVAMLLLLFVVASPRLRLETTTWRKVRRLWQQVFPRKPSLALKRDPDAEARA
jgi:hypothetical protein